MIERHEVETLLTLAEELHFGRTAERLGVSTARVSQTVRKLERRVGAALFERTSRHVALTPVGTQLTEELRPAWTELGAALQRAVDAGRGVTGELRVGFVGPAAAQLLIGATEEFRRRTPGCEVRIREAQPADIPDWLHSGDIDVGLCPFTGTQPGLAHSPVLVREAYVLAVAAGHRLARRREVPVAELAQLPVIHLAAAATPTADMPTGPAAATLHEALTLVGIGRGVLPIGAHAQRYHVRPDITYLPLRDTPLLEWGLVWPADRTNARIRAFTTAALTATGDGR
ncbi:LysR family transcriptional regulator [Nocardia sp. ET3-3]|uniref:LysR family transcriptional regulator n=1 Tax=Nocardia terrae TaxID=2675851 RepID=A0A7K1V358_9NOCA|nr:LysR substrate-binding domain-containing protein [Nocardia terrae]MVU80879.1 LysR family transcriptional regulator [Nocardia terrae]